MAWFIRIGKINYTRRNDVYQYMLNQKEHHKKMSFREEYIKLLKAVDVDFEEAYIFNEPKRWIWTLS